MAEKIVLWRVHTNAYDRAKAAIDWVETDKLTDTSYWVNNHRCARQTNTLCVYLSFEEAHEAAMQRITDALEVLRTQVLKAQAAADAIVKLQPQDCLQSTSRW